MELLLQLFFFSHQRLELTVVHSVEPYRKLSVPDSRPATIPINRAKISGTKLSNWNPRRSFKGPNFNTVTSNYRVNAGWISVRFGNDIETFSSNARVRLATTTALHAAWFIVVSAWRTRWRTQSKAKQTNESCLVDCKLVESLHAFFFNCHARSSRERDIV